MAAILRQNRAGSVPELLFIERAAREGDPWSGQIAFPGGRREPQDESDLSTAIRETQEEVGLTLSSKQLLGELEGLRGSRSGPRQLTVSAFVFDLSDRSPPLVANAEVADTLWVSLELLADPRRAVDYRYPPYPDEVFRGIQLDERRVLWGLTLRLVDGLLRVLEDDQSPRESSERRA